MISISEPSISDRWLKNNFKRFSLLHDIPDNAIISFNSSYYGKLVVFTSYKIKDQSQQELIHCLTKRNENYTKFTDSCIRTD